MVEFKVEVSGLAELRARLAEATIRLDVGTREATVAAAAIAETTIKDELRKTSHPKGTVTPSAPGDPPSLVSGNLMRSVAVDGPTGGAGVYGARIGPTAVYGRIQELGGTTGRGHRTHLPPRPYVEPSRDKSEAAVRALYLAAWSRIFE